MSFVSALPAQQPLFGLPYFLKRSVDSASASDITTFIQFSFSDVSAGLDLVSMLSRIAHDNAYGQEFITITITKITRDAGFGKDIASVLKAITRIALDAGSGKDIVSVIKEYVEACGLPVPLVRDGYLIEPEDHNLQVEAYLTIKKKLMELGLI